MKDNDLLTEAYEEITCKGKTKRPAELQEANSNPFNFLNSDHVLAVDATKDFISKIDDLLRTIRIYEGSSLDIDDNVKQAILGYIQKRI